MVKLSDAAVAKARTRLHRDPAAGPPLALRVTVRSGLSYRLSFDDQVRDSDIHAEFDGVRVIVDEMSAAYLTGTPARGRRCGVKVKGDLS